MQISKKDIYLVESAGKADEWTIVYNELRRLGHVVHTVTLSPDENGSRVMDNLFLPTTIEKIKSVDFVLKIGSANDLVTNYQLGVARALKKRLANLVFKDSQKVNNPDLGIYEIVQVCTQQTIQERLTDLLSKIEESSLDIRFNLFIDKRIDSFLKEAVSCSSKSKSEIIRDLIYKEINQGIKKPDNELWSMPPRIKILEALGAVSDKRIMVSIDKNQAMVHASNGKKTYNVSYDESRNIIVSNDNGSYFAEFLGYPAIAMLMKIGKIRYNGAYAGKLRGIKWKPLNDRFPGTPERAEEYIYDQVLNLSPADKTDMQKYCDLILEDLNQMKLQKPDVIPKPPMDIVVPPENTLFN